MASGKSTGQLPVGQIVGLPALFFRAVFLLFGIRSIDSQSQKERRRLYGTAFYLSVEKSDRTSA